MAGVADTIRDLVQLQRDARNRAIAQPGLLFARADTVGWEALTATLLEGPTPGEHWIVHELTAWGILTANPPASGTLRPPLAGLFLVPLGTPPESLAAGQAAPGFDIQSRGLPLSVDADVTALAAGSGYVFHIHYSGDLAIPLILQAGLTVRGVVTCNPGTATPGPGVGSSMVLSLHYVRNRDLVSGGV